MTEAHACEQLAQGCYLEVDQPKFEPATFRITSKRSTVKQHMPQYSVGVAISKQNKGIDKDWKYRISNTVECKIISVV